MPRYRRSALLACALLLAACHQAPPPNASIVDARQAEQVHDYGRAIAILRPLAEAGDHNARRDLAAYYFIGKGTAVDVPAAVSLLTGPAEAGDSEAQAMLGAIYASGRAGPGLDGLAFRWTQLAAMQNNGDAEFTLGNLYRLGKGVPKDDKQAVLWTVKAAEQGLPSALANIAGAYIDGIGVPKNDEQALYWLDVALLRLGPGDPTRGSFQAIADRISGQVLVSDVQRIAANAHGWSLGKGALDRVLVDAGLPPNGPATGVAAGYSEGMPAGPSGSGVVINRAGDVLTDRHVVRGCASAFVRIAGGPRIDASVVASDDAGDLAVLRPKTAIGEPAVLRERVARQSERVYAAGFPLRGVLASDLNVSDGVVSALAGAGDNSHQLQITAPIQSGNSGGPVFDEDGAMVGLVEAALNSLAFASAGAITQNANFAIKASSVREFLDARGIGYEAAAAGSAHGKVAAYARRTTVAVECTR